MSKVRVDVVNIGIVKGRSRKHKIKFIGHAHQNLLNIEEKHSLKMLWLANEEEFHLISCLGEMLKICLFNHQ